MKKLFAVVLSALVLTFVGCSDIEENVLEELPSQASEQSESIEETASTNQLQAEELPEEIPVETPVEVPEETPVEVPEETPVEVPEETPVEVSEEAPVELPEETPVEVPEETPVEVPEETPIEIPKEEIPAEPPKEEPKKRADNIDNDMATAFLNGQSTFHINDATGEEYTLHTYYALFGYSESSYCLADIDGDAMNELLVYYALLDETLIIDQYNGVSVGIPVQSGYNLCENGFHYYEGLRGEYIAKITTDENGMLVVNNYVTMVLTEGMYLIDGKEATEAEVLAEFDALEGKLVKWINIPSKYKINSKIVEETTPLTIPDDIDEETAIAILKGESYLGEYGEETLYDSIDGILLKVPLYYSLTDIDGDGLTELIVHCDVNPGEYNDTLIVDAKDGIATVHLSSLPQKNGFLLYRYSGYESALDKITTDDSGKLVFVDILIENLMENKYYLYDKEITNEEAEAILKNFEDSKAFELIAIPTEYISDINVDIDMIYGRNMFDVMYTEVVCFKTQKTITVDQLIGFSSVVTHIYMDIDGDGATELLLKNSNTEDVIIVDMRNDVSTAYFVPSKQIQDIKTDATMSWSDGEFKRGVSRIEITDTGILRKDIIVYDSKNGNYIVNGKTVSEQEALASLEDQEVKESTDWIEEQIAG